MNASYLRHANRPGGGTGTTRAAGRPDEFVTSRWPRPFDPRNPRLSVSVVFVAAMFMTIMDSTVVNVALPTLRHQAACPRLSPSAPSRARPPAR
jgi:hypothetical protein